MTGRTAAAIRQKVPVKPATGKDAKKKPSKPVGKPSKSRSRKPGEKTVSYNGRFYRIPVDENGYVPVTALAQRYQEFGNSKRDRCTDADVIYPLKSKPEEIVAWWADPSSSDIQGIDTKDSVIYDVRWIRDPEMRDAQARIAVVTPSKSEQRRIRMIIAESFSAKELRAMTRGPSVVIETKDSLGKATGYYLRRSDGVEVPLITLEKGTTPDGTVHEMVHHARTTRKPGSVTSSPIPVDSTGKVDEKACSRMSPNRKAMLHDAEESATVAETVVRTRTDPRQSGYYDKVGGRAAYINDRQRIASRYCSGKDCALVGAEAIAVTKREYESMEIAKAKLMAPIPAKESVARVSKKSGNGGKTSKKPSKKPSKKGNKRGFRGIRTNTKESNPD